MNFFGWTIIRAKNLARIHERNKQLDAKVRVLDLVVELLKSQIEELKSK